MPYTIEWVGEVAIDLRSDGGRSLSFSLEKDQRAPAEFKEGERVNIVNHPAHPAAIAVGMNEGYYEITHIASGRVLRAYHRADQWRVEE